MGDVSYIFPNAIAGRADHINNEFHPEYEPTINVIRLFFFFAQNLEGFLARINFRLTGGALRSTRSTPRIMNSLFFLIHSFSIESTIKFLFMNNYKVSIRKIGFTIISRRSGMGIAEIQITLFMNNYEVSIRKIGFAIISRRSGTGIAEI